MPDYRQRGEAARLSCSQLLIALRHVKFSGSIVVLMHMILKWHNILTIRAFNQFSDIEIFKPLSSLKARGSFYLIAKNVKPEHPEALKAIAYWTDCWKNVSLCINLRIFSPQRLFSAKTYGFANKGRLEAWRGEENITLLCFCKGNWRLRSWRGNAWLSDTKLHDRMSKHWECGGN